MPYPESCPECEGPFRNTGTHFTARRQEVGRHVLLELGCQNSMRRFWWDFTTGSVTEEGRPGTSATATRAAAAREARQVLLATVAAEPPRNGTHHTPDNGHLTLSTLDRPDETPMPVEPEPAQPESTPVDISPTPEPLTDTRAQATPALADVTQPEALKAAFVRQLHLDRLTMRQMRSLLMSEEARRAIEIAAGATEATYERLALILFAADLPQLLGKPAPAPVSASMSAEERLELQREKARIRARLRRAAIKAAKTADQ